MQFGRIWEGILHRGFGAFVRPVPRIGHFLGEF
jgi:hypothetical protein